LIKNIKRKDAKCIHMLDRMKSQTSNPGLDAGSRQKISICLVCATESLVFCLKILL